MTTKPTEECLFRPVFNASWVQIKQNNLIAFETVTGEVDEFAGHQYILFKSRILLKTQIESLNHKTILTIF